MLNTQRKHGRTQFEIQLKSWTEKNGKALYVSSAEKSETIYFYCRLVWVIEVHFDVTRKQNKAQWIAWQRAILYRFKRWCIRVRPSNRLFYPNYVMRYFAACVYSNKSRAKRKQTIKRVSIVALRTNHNHLFSFQTENPNASPNTNWTNSDDEFTKCAPIHMRIFVTCNWWRIYTRPRVRSSVQTVLSFTLLKSIFN